MRYARVNKPAEEVRPGDLLEVQVGVQQMYEPIDFVQRFEVIAESQFLGVRYKPGEVIVTIHIKGYQQPFVQAGSDRFNLMRPKR